MEQLETKMPAEMIRALQQIARAQDISIGQLLRNLAAKEISRLHKARPPNRADERLVAPLRARLAGDLAHAACWDDLQTRLRCKGYELREAGGGLALHAYPSGARQCKASELGFSYSRLMRRFHAPFPGHAHTWLAERFLHQGEDDDDPVLIEDP